MLQLGTGNEYASQAFAPREKITYRETDVTVYRRMLDLNAERLNETALICLDRKTTYRALFAQADHVADLLTTMGVRKNDMILLAGEGCAQTVSILLACSKIGVGILMLQPKTPEDVFNLAVATVDIPLMFCEAGEYIKYAGMKGTGELSSVIVLPEGQAIGEEEPGQPGAASNVMLWKDFLGLPVTETAEEVLGGNYPLTICSTTGSIGIPKGIVMPNSSYIAVGLKLRRSGLPWETGDVFMDLVPPYIVSGTSFVLLVPMMLGMTVLLEPRKGEQMGIMMEEIGRYGVNHMLLTKSVWLIMAQFFRQDWDMSSLKCAYTVGEPISESEFEIVDGYLKERGAGRLQNFYGMSEANSILTCAGEGARASSGHVMAGDAVAVFNPETGREMKLGEVGELFFRTPSAMKEYLYNPAATKEFFVRDNRGGRWCRTGDLATVDADGGVHVFGRVKEKFTAENGAVVYPYMIERILGNEENVLRLKMISSTCGGRPAMAVHVVPKCPPADAKAYADKLYAMLRDDGSLPVLPKRIRLRGDFPMNQGGKIDMLAMAAETEGFFEYE